jgi:hypothetical protein
MREQSLFDPARLVFIEDTPCCVPVDRGRALHPEVSNALFAHRLTDTILAPWARFAYHARSLTRGLPYLPVGPQRSVVFHCPIPKHSLKAKFIAGTILY